MTSLKKKKERESGESVNNLFTLLALHTTPTKVKVHTKIKEKKDNF